MVRTSTPTPNVIPQIVYHDSVVYFKVTAQLYEEYKLFKTLKGRGADHGFYAFQEHLIKFLRFDVQKLAAMAVPLYQEEHRHFLLHGKVICYETIRLCGIDILTSYN